MVQENTNNSLNDEVYGRFWTGFVGGLGGILEQSAILEKGGLEQQKQARDIVADYFNQKATAAAAIADNHGMSGNTALQKNLDQTANALKNYAEGLKSNEKWATELGKVVDFGKLPHLDKLELLGKNAGPFADLISMGIDTYKEDYYSGIGTAVGAVVAALFIVAASLTGGPALIVGIIVSYLVSEIVKNTLNFVDPYVRIALDKFYTIVYDPLTLDLNGDGKLSTVGTDGGINFDFNGDGLAGNTGLMGDTNFIQDPTKAEFFKSII